MFDRHLQKCRADEKMPNGASHLADGYDVFLMQHMELVMIQC